MKVSFRMVIKVVFVAGLLYFLSRKGLISAQSTQHAFSHWGLLGISVLIMGINSVFAATRLNWLLRAQKIHLPWSRVMELTLIGGFFNIALPGSVSGDMVKAFYIGKESPRMRAQTVGSVLFDRVSGLSGLILLSAIALTLGLYLKTHGSTVGPDKFFHFAPVVMVAVTGMVGFFTYIFFVREHHDPVLRALRKLECILPRARLITQTYLGLRHYHRSRSTVIKVLMLSVAIHAVVGCAIVNFAFASGQRHISILGIFTVFPIGLLATALPVAPAGIGVGHAAFAYCFRLIGSRQGADIFTLYALTQIFWGAVGGLVYLRFRGHTKAELHVLSQDGCPDASPV